MVKFAIVSFLPIFNLRYRTNIIFQVVKMFIAVVIVFAICWLPYHLYFIFTYHFNELTKSPMVQHVYLGFYWLAMSNSMFNPFVYYWMNSRYVHDIWLIFFTPSMMWWNTIFEISKINLTSHFCIFCRFRSYIKALFLSIKMACCNPKRLLRRSYSRSSLDIGVIPFDHNLMKAEMNRRVEQYTCNSHIIKAAAFVVLSKLR